MAAYEGIACAWTSRSSFLAGGLEEAPILSRAPEQTKTEDNKGAKQREKNERERTREKIRALQHVQVGLELILSLGQQRDAFGQIPGRVYLLEFRAQRPRQRLANLADQSQVQLE